MEKTQFVTNLIGNSQDFMADDSKDFLFQLIKNRNGWINKRNFNNNFTYSYKLNRLHE